MPSGARVARRLAGALPVAAVGGFMALFFVWPIAGVIARGLGGTGPAAALGDVLGSGSHRSVIWFTIWQAALSTALTVAVALPAAGAMARLRFRGQRLVRALATVPFVLPTVVVAAAFEGLFDRFGLAGGAVSLRHTVWAVLMAHIFFNYAVVLRTVGAHWAALDARVEDQARVLGASRPEVFRRVVLPRLAPSIAAASAIVFLFSFTSFGVVLVLGGPARATIETEIYRFAVVRLDLATAAALAIVQLLAVVALVVVSNALERRRAVAEPVSSPAAAPRSRGLGLVANLAVMAMILGLPIAVLVERSLAAGRSGGYTLRNYTAMAERVNLLPDTALAALGNSLMFAAPAAALALAVGGAATLVVIRAGHGRSRRIGRAFDIGLTLPLGTSAVTVGLGFLVVLNRPPIDIRTSLLVVPIAHAVVGIPFVVRTLVPMLRTVNPRTREAAAVLGASPRRVRREVDLRVAARGLAVGAGFAFAVSLGEFGATSFVPRRPETLTAPLALFRLLGTPGEVLRGQAMALAVALMALTAVAVFVMDLWGDTRRGVF
jgi:thiamine transport system permease protein